jgi:hypothetical protein
MLYEYNKLTGLRWHNDKRGMRITEFEFQRMRYDASCANSHSAPKGMPTNWGGNAGPGVPRGYPGWRGRVEFTDEQHGWQFSEILQKIGIHTGTGGSGSFDVSVWAADFRKMAEPYVLAKLSGDII